MAGEAPAEVRFVRIGFASSRVSAGSRATEGKTRLGPAGSPSSLSSDGPSGPGGGRTTPDVLAGLGFSRPVSVAFDPDYDRYYVARGEQIVDVWPIMGRAGAAQR